MCSGSSPSIFFMLKVLLNSSINPIFSPYPTYKPLPNVILAWDPSTDTLAAKNMKGPTIYGKSSDLSGGTPLSNLQKTLVIQMSVG